MSNIILSPNMNLPVPIVGQEPGPQYATDVNSSLNIIDGHNHTPGYGVPVPSNGINYNADISANNNRLTSIKSLVLLPQNPLLPGVTPDLDAVYASGVDLYYNDGNGVQIRLTQNGTIAGTAGSISGLTPPASVSYSSGTETFIFQSGVNTSASLDSGSITIRENVANAKGITIQSPTGLPADYSLTLPSSLPVSTSFLLLDSAGNITTSTGITQAQTVRRTTSQTASIGQIMLTPSSGNFTSSSITPTNITNLSGTLVTTGNPIKISIEPSTGDNVSMIEVVNISGTALTAPAMYFRLLNGATIIASWQVGPNSLPVGDLFSFIPSFSFTDYSGAGTQAYDLQVAIQNPGGYTAIIKECVLVAYEM